MLSVTSKPLACYLSSGMPRSSRAPVQACAGCRPFICAYHWHISIVSIAEGHPKLP